MRLFLIKKKKTILLSAEFGQLEEQSEEATGAHNRAGGRGEEARIGGARSSTSSE